MQRRRPNPGRPLVAAVILALLLSGAAYAVVRYVIIGSPAPPQIKVSEQALDRAEASLDVFGPDTVGQVEVARTRAEGILTTGSGPVYLWVAPTRQGSECAFLEITGLDVTMTNGSPFLMRVGRGPIGCISPGGKEPLLDVVNVGIDGRTLSVVTGYVPPPAKSVTLRFANGPTSRAYPVIDGYVLALGSPADPRPEAIIRSADGHEIGSLQRPFPLRLRMNPTGPAEFTITLRLRHTPGTLTLRVGPAADGGTCTQLQSSNGTFFSICGHHVSADAIHVHLGSIGSPRQPRSQVLYLEGPVGTNIAKLELLYPNGSHAGIPIEHGWVLYELNPAEQPTPSKLIARDTSGAVVATQAVGR